MILLNDFRLQWLDVRADVFAATELVGASGWYILGEQVKRFEGELADYWGVNSVVGVASGLDAIEIALRTLGCSRGDRVLTSPISAFATVLAILKIGASPVFVDCDSYGLLDIDACRRVLSTRDDIRYFVPVHLFGHSLDLGAIRALRDDYELKVVEDCAQSIGASANGQPTGTVGQLAATSFYPTKNLGALGDAGAILCSSPEYEARARCLRDYGQKSKYRHEVVGYNSRLDELQAAYLAHAFLPRLNDWIAKRRRIAEKYCLGIRHSKVQVVGAPPFAESSWHLFPILVGRADKSSLIRHLNQNCVATAEHYPLALTEQKALHGLLIEPVCECIEAKRFCHAEVSLPIHPYLSDADVDQVVRSVNSWPG